MKLMITDYRVEPKGNNGYSLFKNDSFIAWGINEEAALKKAWICLGSISGGYCTATTEGVVLLYEPIGKESA